MVVLLLMRVLWRSSNTWSLGPSLPHCESSGSSIHSCECPSPSLHNKDTCNWQHSHIDYLGYGEKTKMLGKKKWKPIKFFPGQEIK